MGKDPFNFNLKTKSKDEINVKTPPGSISGTVLKVLGFFGIGVVSVLLIPVLFYTLFSGESSIPLGITFGLLSPLLLLSLIMTFKGISLRKRVERFRLYVKQFKGKNFCAIKDLAGMIRKSNKYVAKEDRKSVV